MPKTKSKRSPIKLVHLQALIFVVVYFLVSNLIVAKFIINPNIYISFLFSFLFGVVSVFAFLYLFSHEDFFPFFKNLRKNQDKKEKRYIKNYIKYGKLLACIIVGVVGGPIFLALTIIFLFPQSKMKYLIALASTLIATIFVVGFAKGLIKLVF